MQRMQALYLKRQHLESCGVQVLMLMVWQFGRALAHNKAESSMSRRAPDSGSIVRRFWLTLLVLRESSVVCNVLVERSSSCPTKASSLWLRLRADPVLRRVQGKPETIPNPSRLFGRAVRVCHADASSARWAIFSTSAALALRSHDGCQPWHSRCLRSLAILQGLTSFSRTYV